MGFVLASACSSKASTQVSEVQAYYPLDTRTGIAEVDSVLAAVQSGDPHNLSALIHYTVAPCTTAEGLGGPPKCQAGETEGTQLEVLPILGSEGSFIRKSEMGNWQGVNVNGIYAIYRVSPNAPSDQYYPSGEYAILLTAPENHPAISIHVGNAGIERMDYLLDALPGSLKTVMERDATEVILEPKLR